MAYLDRLKLTALACAANFLAAAPAHAQVAGSMQYNDSANNYEFYDGTNWYLFSATTVALSSCTQKAVMNFSIGLIGYQYCNGSQLRTMTGALTLTPCTVTGAMEFRSNTYMYCNGIVWLNMKGALRP